MNARSLFSQPVIPNWYRMWPHQKDRSARKKKMKSEQLAVQYIPEGLLLSQTSAFRLLSPFWNHGPIYPVYRSSPCLKWCPILRGLHSPEVRKHCQIISPVISGFEPIRLTFVKATGQSNKHFASCVLGEHRTWLRFCRSGKHSTSFYVSRGVTGKHSTSLSFLGEWLGNTVHHFRF